MMMNGTYGCPPVQHHMHHSSPDYDTKLFYPSTDQQHHSYGYQPDPAEPATGHLPPHQIINEPNGLSYTNLDTTGQSSTGHYRHQYSSSSSYYHHQTFEYADTHQDNNIAGYHHHGGYYHHHHHQAMSRTGRTTMYQPDSAGYQAGFAAEHHVVQQECVQQLNGGAVVAPYQRSVQHQQPVPTYKWMQVKRALPKPGKYIFFNLIMKVKLFYCSTKSYISIFLAGFRMFKMN